MVLFGVPSTIQPLQDRVLNAKHHLRQVRVRSKTKKKQRRMCIHVCVYMYVYMYSGMFICCMYVWFVDLSFLYL